MKFTKEDAGLRLCVLLDTMNRQKNHQWLGVFIRSEPNGDGKDRRDIRITLSVENYAGDYWWVPWAYGALGIIPSVNYYEGEQGGYYDISVADKTQLAYLSSYFFQVSTNQAVRQQMKSIREWAMA